MSCELSFPKKQVALVELNNPTQKNAITMEMIDRIESLFFELQTREDVSVVLLSGKGSAFCAGGDIKAMKEKKGMFAGDSLELMKRYQQGIQRIPKAIDVFKKPLIALINGAAIGAGLDLACMCDIRIAAKKAMLSESFAKLGLVPGDGGTFFLSRVVGYTKALEMILTARAYKAEDALSFGLVNHVVDQEKLLDEGLKWADEILSNDIASLEMAKSALKAARNSELQTQLDLLSAYQGIAQRRDEHFQRLQF